MKGAWIGANHREILSLEVKFFPFHVHMVDFIVLGFFPHNFMRSSEYEVPLV